MKEFKIVWEERKTAIVKANSKEEAEDKFMSGEFDVQSIHDEEITQLPEAFEL